MNTTEAELLHALKLTVAALLRYDVPASMEVATAVEKANKAISHVESVACTAAPDFHTVLAALVALQDEAESHQGLVRTGVGREAGVDIFDRTHKAWDAARAVLAKAEA